MIWRHKEGRSRPAAAQIHLGAQGTCAARPEGYLDQVEAERRYLFSDRYPLGKATGP